jgi:nicotinamide mononucleotide adenylyltransferase
MSELTSLARKKRTSPIASKKSTTPTIKDNIFKKLIVSKKLSDTKKSTDPNIKDEIIKKLLVLKQSSEKKVSSKKVSKVIDPFTGEIYDTKEKRGKHLKELIDYCNKCPSDKILDYVTGKCISKDNRIAKTNKKLKKIVKFCKGYEDAKLDDDKKPFYKKVLDMTINKEIFGIEFKLKDIFPESIKRFTTTIKNSNEIRWKKISKNATYGIIILMFVTILISTFPVLRNPIIYKLTEIFGYNHRYEMFFNIFNLINLMSVFRNFSGLLNANTLTRILTGLTVAATTFGERNTSNINNRFNSTKKTYDHKATFIPQYTTKIPRIEAGSRRALGMAGLTTVDNVGNPVLDRIKTGTMIPKYKSELKNIDTDRNGNVIGKFNVNINNQNIPIDILLMRNQGTDLDADYDKNEFDTTKKRITTFLKNQKNIISNKMGDLSKVMDYNSLMHVKQAQENALEYASPPTKERINKQIETLTKKIKSIGPVTEKEQKDFNMVDMAKVTEMHNDFMDYILDVNNAGIDQYNSLEPIYLTVLSREKKEFDNMSLRKPVIKNKEDLRTNPINAVTSSRINELLTL